MEPVRFAVLGSSDPSELLSKTEVEPVRFAVLGSSQPSELLCTKRMGPRRLAGQDGDFLFFFNFLNVLNAIAWNNLNIIQENQ